MKLILLSVLLALFILSGCKSNRQTVPVPDGKDSPPPASQKLATTELPPAVIEAAKLGNVEQVQSFLAQGGNVNSTDAYHTTLLHFAAEGGQEQLVAFLIEKGVSVNAANDDGFTPLHNCALHGDSATAVLLISKGAILYTRDNNQMTPLHLCGLNNNVAVAKVLVKAGADVNDMTATQWTPLRVAEYGKSSDLIAWYKSQGVKQ